jgi:hypothetical protein
MTVLIIISALLVALYVGAATWALRRLPDSLSAMVAVLPEGSARWVWTVWLWTVSLLTLIPVIDRLSSIGMEMLGFGALACLMFCGAMPLFDKDNLDKHWVFGVAGALLSQECVFFIGHRWLWLWMAFPLLFLFYTMGGGSWKRWKSKVLWAEMICYATQIGSVLCSVLP